VVTDPATVGSDLVDLIDDLASAGDRWPIVRTGDRQPIADGVRLGVKMRDGFACVWCYSTYELVLDHIVPWSAGGSDDPTNLRTLCWTCNETRSNRRYAGDTNPRLPLSGGCTACQQPVEDEWNDLVAVFCLMCRRRGRAIAAHMPPEPAEQRAPATAPVEPATREGATS
jgi:hypothetical protein